MYEAVVIGSGPAGLSAALYLKRAGKNIIVIEKEYEGAGQITQSIRVDNYLGIPSVSGETLGERFRQHVLDTGVLFLEDEVEKILYNNRWSLCLSSGRTIETETILYAAGAVPKTLGIPGEKEYLGKGISYCAYCDGSLYEGKDAAVIGGGDTALDDARYLSDLCKKVYLIHRRAEFRGNEATLEILKARDNVEIITQASIKRAEGKKSWKRYFLTMEGGFLSAGFLWQLVRYRRQICISINLIIQGLSNGIPDAAQSFSHVVMSDRGAMEAKDPDTVKYFLDCLLGGENYWLFLGLGLTKILLLFKSQAMANDIVGV